VNYAGQTTINIVMKETASALDEIIVVGYGTQQKSSLTGSVTQIKGSELLKSPANNISSILGGRVAGLSSVQESGQPGADFAGLRIRGSRAGVSYIVDGMPRSINDIDPNDVETISILKDASSAAVYGMQSAGGVIIITTKKGKAGDSKITYKGSVGASMNANFPKFLDGPGYAYWYNKALELDGNNPVFTAAQVGKMTNGDDSDGWGNTDWIKETYKVGITEQHNVTATGGTDNIKYFASLGYLDQKGNVENFLFSRYNLRSNIDAKIAKNLTLTLGIAGSVSDTQKSGLRSRRFDGSRSINSGLVIGSRAGSLCTPLPSDVYWTEFLLPAEMHIIMQSTQLRLQHFRAINKSVSSAIQTNIYSTLGCSMGKWA
jgi:TonB-dependent SusC/RagA subfamily outer membrane receptor